jgi:hypothetical protein
VKAVVYEGWTDFEPGRWFGHENLGEVVDVGHGFDAPKAYEHVDKRDDDSTKVLLHPAMAGA